jgi:Major Facilitator Superfamily
MSKPWVRVALLLFCVGWGANHFVALLLVYKARLALDAAAPAALLGMYALGLLPGLLLSGPLSDRYGRRALVFPATAVTLAASALLGAGGGNFHLLLAGRLLYGIGAGAAMNPGAVWLLELSAQTEPGQGARRATLALSAGFGFGPLLSGLLAQYAPYPTVLPYVAHLIVSAVAFCLALGAPAPPRAVRSRAPLLRIGLNRANRGPFLRGVVWMAPFVFAFPGIAFATLPVLAGGRLRPSTVGTLAALTLAAGMLAQPFTRRIAPTAAARAGLAVGALGIVLGAGATAWHGAGLLLAAAGLLGVAYGVCMTSGLRTVEALSHPESRAGLTGLYYVLTYVGFGTPLGLALVARRLPPTMALLGVAALALLAALALRAPSPADESPVAAPPASSDAG